MYISLCWRLPPIPILFCGSNRLFFSTRLLHCRFNFCCISFPLCSTRLDHFISIFVADFFPGFLGTVSYTRPQLCRIDGMPCTYKHWMKRPMCIRPLRRDNWVKIKPLMTQSSIFFRSLFFFSKACLGKESK